MPLDEKELLERDAKRNIGEELLQAVRDIKAGRVGRVSTVEVSPSGIVPSQNRSFPERVRQNARCVAPHPPGVGARASYTVGRGEVSHHHCHQETGCFERTARRLRL